MKGLGFTAHWLPISLIFSVLMILLNTTQGQAQSGVELELTAVSKFGEHVTFTARLKSPQQIQSATILIHDSTQIITHVQPVTFDGQGVSEYRFDTRQNSIRPFTTLLYRYELTLPDGSKLQSQTASIRYDDDRFTWQTLQTDSLRIHWYGRDEAFGASALNAAQAGIQKINEFFPADLAAPVDIFIYANESDLRGVLYEVDEAWAAGHADSGAGIITVTIEAGANQNILLEQRLSHELMHVMLHRQVGAGSKNIPAWLREGLSMLAEVYPNPDYDSVLRDAAARNALIPMRDLCASFSPRIDSAFLAYAQSRSFTDYLRGVYGADGLLTLANIYAGGVACERGPERAFGVSFAKLERDWRVTTLGQTDLMSTLGNFAPYLVLLCLVVLFPFIGVIGSMRKKGNPHG